MDHVVLSDQKTFVFLLDVKQLAATLNENFVGLEFLL
jgi:hypothetical protein